jgi:lipid-binding SYLF domain-containing protein
MAFKNVSFRTAVFVTVMAGLVLISERPAVAASAKEIDKAVDAGLEQLFEKNPDAKALAERAEAILVFPKIVKAGFVVGVQRGLGALREDGETIGYFKTASASYGLQAGVQKFGYALFFMSDEDVDYVRRSGGWEVGVGPSIVIVDAGTAKAMTTTTAKKGIYAIFFSQKGLMAGMGLQGTKISEIKPDD